MNYPHAYYNSHMRSAYNLGGDRFRQDIDESFKAALDMCQMREDELRLLAMKAFKDQVACQFKRLIESVSGLVCKATAH